MITFLNKQAHNSGFTLIEIVIATAIAMVLMFGALYSTSETLEVVREGDIRVHTNINARRALDRLLKDCRYASEIEVTEVSADKWLIEVETTGSLSPGEIEYSWDANSQLLQVGLENEAAEALISDVRSFDVNTLTATIDGNVVVTRISISLEIGIDDGYSAGAANANAERTLQLAGSTWIRRNET